MQGLRCILLSGNITLSKGDKVGIIGLGGLGHMGIKLAVAMGAEVVAITSSQNKVGDAIELGAEQVLVSTDDNAVDLATGTFDLLINTIPADHDFSQYLGLLKRDKTMVIVGASHMKMFSMNLLFGRKKWRVRSLEASKKLKKC